MAKCKVQADGVPSPPLLPSFIDSVGHDLPYGQTASVLSRLILYNNHPLPPPY